MKKKNKKENYEKNLLESDWSGKGEGKKDSEIQMFFSQAHWKIFFPNWEEK